VLQSEATNTQIDRPFTWESQGMLAYVGGYEAVSNLPGKYGKLTGFKSWLRKNASPL